MMLNVRDPRPLLGLDARARIALFGPPGIGKSSIIEGLRRRKIFSAIDAETFPASERRNKARDPRIQILGAADLPPEFLRDQGYFLVLLDLPQKLYERQRATRDRRVPSKSLQPVHTTQAWRTSHHWDAILSPLSLTHDVRPY